MKIKQFINHTIYLAYYFKKLDYAKFIKFVNFVHKKNGITKVALCADAILSSYKYGTGLMDYFYFRFYEKSDIEKRKWVGTGFKYEFDLKMNPKNTRIILEDKILFLTEYAPFIQHAYFTLADFENNRQRVESVLNNSTGKIVLKDSRGQCGFEVEIHPASTFTIETLQPYMKRKGFNMGEEFIRQHEEITNLSPTAINTIRLITIVNANGHVDFLGGRLRISVNNHVDNLASGNIACPIDMKTGVISGLGVYSDITKEAVTHHPVTGVKLIGFKIPMWDEIIENTKKIALHHPENRAVGWDVVLTDKGPDFLEGNHNWCEILWQLPVNKGMKDVLKKYMKID